MLLLLLSALTCWGGPHWVSAAPGFLDFDNLPETGFSCEGKVIGGYYADVETGCQMFHVCTVGQKGEVMDIKFLCLNGTVFDQETRVCERVDEVDCSKTEGFYDLNLELYGAHGFSIHEEDSDEEGLRAPTVPPSSSTSSTSTTTTSTSTTTTSTTTTPRPTQSFPSSSPGAVALLAIHNSFAGVRPQGAELRPPSADLQPPTAPTYTLRQQHHPHGVAHTFFSNTPRPFQFFGRSLGGSAPAATPGAPTVIATSRTMTSSVSVPARPRTPPPTLPPPTAPTGSDDEEYDVDYALESFYKDVPKVAHSQSVSLSVSTSSSSSKPIIVAHRPAVRAKRQSRRGRVHQRRPAPVKEAEESKPEEEVAPSSTPPTIPETSFSCADKVPGGFYADVEAECKVFHICVQGRHNKINDHKFLCGVGTKFDQQSRTCVAQESVRCRLAPSLYHLNDHFLPPQPEEKILESIGFESQKVRSKRNTAYGSQLINRQKRASNKKTAPRYTLNTLPAESEGFVCPHEDGLYADSASECQAYHQCVGQTHSVHICPHPSVFNEALGVCDQWDKVDCGLYADGFHDSVRTRPKRQVVQDTCDTSVQPAGTPIPDTSEQCRSYHLCVFSSGHLVRLQLKCPTGKVMHPELRRCVRGDTCEAALLIKSTGLFDKKKQYQKPSNTQSKNKLNEKKSRTIDTEAVLSKVSGSRGKRTASKLMEAASSLGAALESVHLEAVRRVARDLDELSLQKYAPDKPSRLDEYVDDDEREASPSEGATAAPEQRVLEATEAVEEETTTSPPEEAASPGEFSCRGRRLEAFHVNPWDCRLFHMCAPAGVGRLLNMRFACGAGAVFEEAAQKCVPRTFCLR